MVMKAAQKTTCLSIYICFQNNYHPTYFAYYGLHSLYHIVMDNSNADDIVLIFITDYVVDKKTIEKLQMFCLETHLSPSINKRHRYIDSSVETKEFFGTT